MSGCIQQLDELVIPQRKEKFISRNGFPANKNVLCSRKWDFRQLRSSADII